jgi:hypothetical protein
MNEIASMIPWAAHNLFDLTASIEYLLFAGRYFIFTEALAVYTHKEDQVSF